MSAKTIRLTGKQLKKHLEKNFPKDLMNSSQKEDDSWIRGYNSGKNSVLEFIKEMSFIDIKEFEEEYNCWANADEYTTRKGIIIKRY